MNKHRDYIAALRDVEGKPFGTGWEIIESRGYYYVESSGQLIRSFERVRFDGDCRKAARELAKQSLINALRAVENAAEDIAQIETDKKESL